MYSQYTSVNVRNFFLTFLPARFNIVKIASEYNKISVRRAWSILYFSWILSAQVQI